MIPDSIPGRRKEIFLFSKMSRSAGTHQAYYSVGTKGSDPGGKMVHVKLTTNLHLVPRAT